jgi:hypothetical protein
MPQTERECAFCAHSAKLSGEHIWSEWMRELFPTKKIRFTSFGEKHEVLRQWSSHDIDMTAKVVCQKCNNEWMSGLESAHAKPAMTDLIVGDKELTISEMQARGIAVFAFKTAVIAEHMKRYRQRFYSREVRHEFAKALNIPRNTQIWMAGFLPMGSGHIHSCYHEGKIDSTNRIEMHVCTYSVGHLTFQVVSARCTLPSLLFRPMQGFDHLAAPFWPEMPVPIHWPPNDVLRTKEDWEAFSNRWRKILPP